jgi:2-dehydro-3-deoxyphosphogluconate aldolase/(4S)-4-hydroxy-2-oxoglutarate aldolase
MTTPAPFSALQVMQDAPVIPVIVLTDVAHAVPMARALVAGGMRMLEVTLRTPQGPGLHRSHCQDVPEAVVVRWHGAQSKADAQAAAKRVRGLR